MNKLVTITFLMVIFSIDLAFSQSDVSIGPDYKLNIQRQTGNADAYLMHNAKLDATYNEVYRWETTHPTFGSRGFRFSYLSGIHFFAESGATTSGSIFSPTTRFFVGNNGSVGVGTTSADGFQVNATIAQETTVGVSNVRMGVMGGTPRIILDHGGFTPFEIDNASGRLRIFTPGVERFTMTSSGSVGIGTVAPGNRLTIAQGSGTPRSGAFGLQLYNGSSNADSRNWMIETPFSGAGNFNISQYQDASNGGAASRLLILPTNNYSRSADVTIDPSGSLGVGTISPQTSLSVSGNQEDQLHLSRTTSNVGDNIYLVFSHSNNTSASNARARIGVNIQAGGAGRLVFQTGQNGTTPERMRIDETGNVGIGTSSPTQKLTVNGTIYGKEVKVDLNVPGPDYVFEKDYKLPSLDEIKSYIDQHKHLSEVPSAKDMEQNGINLGEMNMILLRKIEELTLHLIEQNKMINKLQAERNPSPDLSGKKVEELTLLMMEQKKDIQHQKQSIDLLLKRINQLEQK
jgi:hypothetical protein